jgi:hypothetical protein
MSAARAWPKLGAERIPLHQQTRRNRPRGRDMTALLHRGEAAARSAACAPARRHRQPSSCSDLRSSWCLVLERLLVGADEHERHGGRNHLSCSLHHFYLLDSVVRRSIWSFDTSASGPLSPEAVISPDGSISGGGAVSPAEREIAAFRLTDLHAGGSRLAIHWPLLVAWEQGSSEVSVATLEVRRAATVVGSMPPL